MLNLTEEEWVNLRVFPPGAKMLNQLKAEISYIQEYMADGQLMDPRSDTTAMNYAKFVGQIEVLRAIVEYQPPKNEEYQGDGTL